ncbi:MAG: leucyl aminopeptidase [Pseudomonadota bacterium]
MEFFVKSGVASKQKADCLIVTVFEDGTLGASGQQIDKASRGAIRRHLRRGDIEGKHGQTLLLHDLPGVSASRVLLLGGGKAEELTDAKYRALIAKAVKTLSETAVKHACIDLNDLTFADRTPYWLVRLAIESAGEAVYRFDQCKSSKSRKHPPLAKITFAVATRAEEKACEPAIIQGQAIAHGVKFAKDLGNLPGNICTPTYLAKQARDLMKRSKKLKVEVLEEATMRRLGMGSLLSVARGSRQPPKLIILKYNGGVPKDKPVVLVGKGLTFDAGGISLKPAAAMDEMKYDMCGAASVLGTIQAVMDMKLPINLIGVIPSSENLPDGNANKPGDIVTSMSGQTIEILNTDAEGRLILCDALTYSERFKPEVVIDIATLTGACVIALGSQASGLMANDQALADQLLAAGRESADRAWQLPLWEEYQDQLKSPFADVANIGGREAGTITGACFLARFTKKFTWAHLDIAGTAWKSSNTKGATGRPVPLLTQYLIKRVQKPKR